MHQKLIATIITLELLEQVFIVLLIPLIVLNLLLNIHSYLSRLFHSLPLC